MLKEEQPRTRNAYQLVWGIALVLAGLGVFVRISQIMPKLMQQFPALTNSPAMIKIGFYLMGIILLGGGFQKIIRFFHASQAASTDEPENPADH